MKKGDVEKEWEKANAKWEEAVKEVKAKQQALIDPVKENDNVTFEVERGMKGMNAVRVKKAQSNYIIL